MGARNPGTMRAQPINLLTGNFSPGWSRGNGKRFTLSSDNYERFCLKKVNRPSKHATRNARADGQARRSVCSGKRKELLSVSMLYNFLSGDVGFLPLLRQLLLQGGTEMITVVQQFKNSLSNSLIQSFSLAIILVHFGS